MESHFLHHRNSRSSNSVFLITLWTDTSHFKRSISQVQKTSNLPNSSVRKQNKKGFEKNCRLIPKIRSINWLVKHKSTLKYKGDEMLVHNYYINNMSKDVKWKSFRQTKLIQSRTAIISKFSLRKKLLHLKLMILTSCLFLMTSVSLSIFSPCLFDSSTSYILKHRSW